MSNSVSKKSDRVKTLILWGVVIAFTLPIFRSGLKTNLTFFEFVKNHTIFAGNKIPEYIPREDYDSIFRENKK
jgi:hypothetical protein